MLGNLLQALWDPLKQQYWRRFVAKAKQAIQEATSYKQIRDIRKQAATDMTGFIINNKYQQRRKIGKQVRKRL